MTDQIIPNPVIFAKALADPTRQQIMQICCCEWLNVNEIVEAVSVNQPTVSHHLAILRDAGLVKIRSEGKYTYYTLNQENMAYCCGRLVQVFAPETEQAGILHDSEPRTLVIQSSFPKVTQSHSKEADSSKRPKKTLLSTFLRVFRIGK